ncbi:MAG: translation elongation factor Ts [Deltaproteobacteria bacterium]|nr:translation elongation factor Ts [Deltaproteobacteria bacterium]
MSQVNMQAVKELRDRTQAGLNDCKSALVEAGGDMEKAVEIILKKGLAKSAKRAGAVATEGEVATRITADGKSGVIADVNIQTDFAARNEDFKRFVQTVLETAGAAADGSDLGAAKLPSGETLEDARKALVGKLGENITVRRWGRLQVAGAGKVHSYVHMGGKIGVLLSVSVSQAEMLAKADVQKFIDDAAMQIAAMAPLHLRGNEVSAAARAKQAEIFEGQLREAEKAPPEAQWPKIIEGKVAKWVKEVTLLEQPSVIETDKTVEQAKAAVEKAAGGTLELVHFIRYERGEGVEAPKGDDFAAEVAKMAGG